MSVFILTARRAAGFAWHGAIVLQVMLGLGAVEGRGQALPTAISALTPSRVELYGGYGYFRPLSGTIGNERYDAIQPGAVGSATYFFDRYLGAQIEGEAFPQGRNDSVGTLEAGPVLRYPYGRFSPFAHVLGGVIRQRGPMPQPPGYGWGVSGGAGLDYVVPGVQHRLAIRLAEADFQYTHVDFGTPRNDGMSGGLGEIKAYRLSAGAVLRFGSREEEPEQPLGYSCAASPATIFAGDPVMVTGSATGTTAGKRWVYAWAANGGQISGTGETAEILTAGLGPGEYTVTGRISQARNVGKSAECMAKFIVQEPPRPPTISCSVDPVSVTQGGKATVTSRASNPQGRPLIYSYNASGGEISGSSAVATLNTGDAPPGSILVECRVSDDLGQSATASATLNIAAPPPPGPAPGLAPGLARRALCSLSFDRDVRRPVRVDDEAKACLDKVALTLNREPTARLEITGEHAADESPAQAAARALNARQYLTESKGIERARIDVNTGSTGGRRVEMELLPLGAPSSYTDAPASRAVPAIGPVKGTERSPVPGDMAAPPIVVEGSQGAAAAGKPAVLKGSTQNKRRRRPGGQPVQPDAKVAK